MEDETKTFLKAWIKVVASLSYCYLISTKLPKGKLRFFSLIPIFTLNTILPLSLSKPIPTIFLSGFITWLTNFKLLLYSFDHGPLSTIHTQKSITRFILFGALPIVLKEKQLKTKQPNNNKILPLNLGSKAFLFAISIPIYYHTKMWSIACFLAYLFLDLAFGVFELLVGPILGVELEPPSDEPYVATSLQDFWGKRWNRIISNSLRHTIYLPTKSFASNFMGSSWASSLALVVCFSVSGLMHELLYFYVTRARPTWEVTWYFVLQGMCVLLEVIMKRNLGQKWALHWAVSCPLTMAFVMGMGKWLLQPQLERNDAGIIAAGDIIAFGNSLKKMVIVYMNLVREHLSL